MKMWRAQGIGALAVLLALPSGAQPRVEVDPPLDPEAARTDWRWIGLKKTPDAPCPPVPGTEWTREALFMAQGGDDTDPQPGDSGETEVPPALRPFCLYEHEHPTAEDLAALRRLVPERLSQVEKDAMAVAMLGELSRETWRVLSDHFLAQAGQIQPALPLTEGRPVRLAVLDTHPTSPRGAPAFRGPSSPHGFTLVHMAKRLLCRGPQVSDCAANVTTQLSLPYESFGKLQRQRPNLEEGGRIGTIGGQARALRREIEAWQRQPPPGEHLVLNLSVGWSRRFGGLEPRVEAMPLPVQAVYRALQDAVCRGAIAVVAAGNLDGGPRPETGPTLPAAWERRPAPAAATCRDRFAVTPAAGSASGGAKAYRPLVYAAGGLRGDGGPLTNGRPRGTPLLAAFGDHAVVQAPPEDAPTATLTGTSVSALVVSAAAAAVWYYRPDLSPHEVMGRVYEGGERLGRRPDFCLGGTAARPCPRRWPVRRVSLCRAVAEACRGGGGCPPAGTLPACPPWPPPPDLSAADLGAFDASSGTPQVDLDELDSTLPPNPPCSNETVHYKGSRPANPCPHRQYFGTGAEPWTEPQPESQVCPNCTLTEGSPWTLYIEIVPWLPGSLRDATLKIGPETYSLGLDPLAAGERVKVSNVPMPDAETPTLLSFTMDGDRSALSPVLVVPSPEEPPPPPP